MSLNTIKDVEAKLDEVMQSYKEATSLVEKMNLKGVLDDIEVSYKSILREQFQTVQEDIVASIEEVVMQGINGIAGYALQYGPYKVTISYSDKGDGKVDIAFGKSPVRRKRTSKGTQYVKILHEATPGVSKKVVSHITAELDKDRDVTAKTHLELFNTLAEKNYSHAEFVAEYKITTPNPLINKTAAKLFCDLGVTMYKVDYTNDEYDLIEIVKAGFTLL